MDTPVTATKAHATGLSTSVAMLALFFLGDKVGLAVPPIEDATAAFVAVAESLGAGGIAWLTTYFTSNKPKEPVE